MLIIRKTRQLVAPTHRYLKLKQTLGRGYNSDRGIARVAVKKGRSLKRERKKQTSKTQ